MTRINTIDPQDLLEMRGIRVKPTYYAELVAKYGV